MIVVEDRADSLGGRELDADRIVETQPEGLGRNFVGARSTSVTRIDALVSPAGIVSVPVAAT